MSTDTVSFGRQRVAKADKPHLVQNVFATVAQRYDVMNDLMSLGTHRVFKRMTLEMTGLRPGDAVLDLAGGTGDMSALLADAVGTKGLVALVDPNEEMMAVGRDRLLDRGLTQVQYCRSPGEALPFGDCAFNAAVISFGLRNFTDKDKALSELNRVLVPGAPLLVLEFSKVEDPLLASLYKGFQTFWPGIGKAVVGDAAPYQYLVESIEAHPGQKALAQMFSDAGFIDVEYHNLLGGCAAIHRGVKP